MSTTLAEGNGVDWLQTYCSDVQRFYESPTIENDTGVFMGHPPYLADELNCPQQIHTLITNSAYHQYHWTSTELTR